MSVVQIFLEFHREKILLCFCVCYSCVGRFMLLCSMSYVFNKSKYEQRNLPSPDTDLQRCSYKQAC